MRLHRVFVWFLLISVIGLEISEIEALPKRILVDTDVVTDDIFALLYLLKLNRSLIDLKAVTISTNTWTDGGHSVNQVYDILYMMDRDDIPVGVGGEGVILPNGTILPDVGGYLPLIDQGISTFGDCRYRQAIPLVLGGRLDTDTNYGLRRGFLPQGFRKYSPLHQPTTQQVMIDTISKGPTTIFLIGTHTNFAIFLMSNPQLKKNIEHIYVMGGGVRSKNPTGCCPKNASSSCKPQQCGYPGNLYTGYTSNPYAEFNIFGDPFAAYQVFHSGIPVTLVPLDATNTIPINEKFFDSFEHNQHTYEAQYAFQSLKINRDTWFDDQFYTSYFMWDSFTSGIASSIMHNSNANGENEFAEMEYMNVTVVTSNAPYGISDGSNPLFSGRATPKFDLQKDGVHSGHVQMGLRDPFCIANEIGKCQDGYTKEVTGVDGAGVLVATKAKANRDTSSLLDREFFVSFLDVLNLPQHTGRFNFTTQFPYYKEVFYKPDFGSRKLGKSVVFDMDMSAGDFISLIYLLKAPVEVINLKGILVSATGWANAATIDIIYDILHMMGRDDIPVGIGDVFALGQPNPSFSIVGDCKYVKAIPQGSGGHLDADTLYGFSRDLPRSPRRYTAENSVKYGAPRDTEHPELRQPLALEVWQSISNSMDPGSKITILANGPLTNLAQIILSKENLSLVVENVYVVGGHTSYGTKDRGNLFSVPSNEYAEFNMFLDPIAAKTVLESELDITLIPLNAQRQVSSYPDILKRLQLTEKTPEAVFTYRLLSRLYHLQQKHHRYHHMDTFLGEILGAVILASDQHLNPAYQVKPVKVLATGNLSEDGQIVIDEKHGKFVKVLETLNEQRYYGEFANLLGEKMQSAVIGSFREQKKMWSTRPAYKSYVSESSGCAMDV
ncbi:hypothetical protein C5167_048601 [Papaver somniferum]|uniref:Inosine/uridine-preferring nucleoside hydrolase domain-containing protein n=2 Tax=Papaver somniferum TaxID=3469 RepID=A0A4Y7KLS9_PAPSO|nr:uncharacterized protein LOC113304633 isoform X1 [Papaver somniferum]RZC73121.1 hypothetical protein C5167_048601 [Papaver somniferum]